MCDCESTKSVVGISEPQLCESCAQIDAERHADTSGRSELDQSERSNQLEMRGEQPAGAPRSVPLTVE